MKETQLNQAQAIDVAIKVFIPEKQVEPVSETETENVAAESVEPVLERVN